IIMTGSKSTRRVVLQKVDVLSVMDEGRLRTQARVVLGLDNQNIVGRVFVMPDDEEMMQTVALATLQALRAVLPEEVQFVLKSTSKLRPQFLNEPLLVVLIDCHYQDLDLDLTGSCIATDENTILGVASAVLNATNRLVGYLLDIGEIENGIEG